MEFQRFGKIPRLSKTTYITEKIDGTNAAIQVLPVFQDEPVEGELGRTQYLFPGDRWGPVVVGAQSRTRLITPGKGTDNYGFAAWVQNHSAELAAGLGPGIHFGEWWGVGINRGYDKIERRFSLFKHRWKPEAIANSRLGEIGVGLVPLLDVTDTFDTRRVDYWIERLIAEGSVAAPGYTNPEGVIVYHSASDQFYKRLIEDDDRHKFEADPAHATPNGDGDTHG